ncbi:uncharacterized protein BDZ99DRAFT_554750 [Mytilinidion resinicola]|uniref:Hydantoinase B/oxoprolinase n=1 Tax=Mytilinidion resinicola TaxID=574789 RepID=A0A6A6YZP2_9PEZI|nr:uncharacterized protein BDZ99DRAFT_554750 [Mytilinidion resinicola]KAF2814311.1 hypothetical protein BDZ99DRAFT_554750 [Mytilinidion resinicola]
MYSLTYELTYELTYSLIYSITYSLVYSITYGLTYELTYGLVHSITIVVSVVPAAAAAYVLPCVNSARTSFSIFSIFFINCTYSACWSSANAPVRLIITRGSAGGVISNLITLDMGGTSTDCALIPGTNAILRRETVVGPLTVKAPSVDVRTVGAGGGSIAHYTALTNALRVGPESAGSTPGPPAYGKGGKLATVTDANLALGYLPSVLLGGKFKLEVAAATAAVEDIAKQMSMSITDTAEGIINLVNETMYGALRLVPVEQGYDPRDFALVAFGGAGPLHANAIGKLLGAFPVIVPPAPGILCAQGDATTKMSHEQSTTYINLFSTICSEELRVAYKGLAEGCSTTMKKSLVDENPALDVSYEADMRYKGQALTLTVQMTASDLEKETETLLTELRTKFATAHEQQFSFSLGTDIDLEVMCLRVKATDASPEVKIQPIEDAPGPSPLETVIMSKSMITVNGEQVEAIFWNRDQITKKGYKVVGPCVITKMDSNTLILPGYSGEIDGMGNILIRPIDEKDKQWEEEIIHTPESAKKYVEENPIIPTLISSPAIREQQDEFNVIRNPAGSMLVGQFGTIEEGDVFVTNDVYQTKGAVSHLNDVIVLLPIHHNGKIVGWAANFGHLTDVQGKVPGSMSINASTIFEDGLQIPSVKLYAKGQYNQSLVDVFCRNSLAACRTAAARVCELCDRYSTEVYHAACDSLLLRCRTAISELIDNKIGTERSNFTDCIDDDGNGIGPYAITCAMQKVGSKLVFDWDGTSPQSGTSIYYYLSTPMFKIFISYFLLAVYDPHNVVNDGPADLIELKIPEGSILHPVRPAALSCRTHLLGRVMDIIQALFRQRNPAFRSAAGFSDSPHLFYSGFKPTDCHCLFPAIKSIPAENIELYFPLVIEANESVANSSGAGFYRGGNAQRTVYRFLCEGEVSIHDDRWLTKPWGVDGGEPGTRSRKGTYRNHSYGTDKEEHEAIPSKCDHICVKPGDVLEWITWCGGGLGDPLTRPPEIVAKEVHRKLVTIECAAKNYGVVVGENWEPDIEKTEVLRKSIKEKGKEGRESMTYKWGWAEEGGVESLVRNAEKKTGLKGPTPQWEPDPYGPHVGLPYVKEWFSRMRREG